MVILIPRQEWTSSSCNPLSRPSRDAKEEAEGEVEESEHTFIYLDSSNLTYGLHVDYYVRYGLFFLSCNDARCFCIVIVMTYWGNGNRVIGYCIEARIYVCMHKRKVPPRPTTCGRSITLLILRVARIWLHRFLRSSLGIRRSGTR